MSIEGAERAFEVATRLREQAERIGVEHGIASTIPQSRVELSMMESQIQTTARRLSNATGIAALSLEVLISELENYAVGHRRLSRWQY